MIYECLVVIYFQSYIRQRLGTVTRGQRCIPMFQNTSDLVFFVSIDNIHNGRRSYRLGTALSRVRLNTSR